ncbi:MAG: hypothetical protein KJ630_14710 [Proteobacteria bacterium]|nr:hypothetical protein [Pseudomonadota bacterium]
MQTKVDILLHCYDNVYSQHHPEDFYLEDIICHFREDEKLAGTVTKVRSIVDKNERDEYKEKNLSIFSPCIYQNKPTGIIQLDIDTYHYDNSVKIKNILINDVPSLLYAFISPSCGVKFAILSDFNCTNKQFSDGYGEVESYIKKILYDADFTDILKFDQDMRSIEKFCYFSHDPEAYYNSNPEIFQVNNYLQSLDYSIHTTDTPSYFPKVSIAVSDADKIVLLEAIEIIKQNKENCLLKKYDRVKLSNAILNVFGYEDGKSIILHDLQLFGGKTEYLHSIIKKINNYDAGTIVHYAKKGGFKRVTDSFKLENTKGNTVRAKLVPKEELRTKRYSTTEALRLVDERIRQFFYERKSIQLIVEMGLGKTLYAARHAARYLEYMRNNNKNVKIAFFVPSHKLGNEILPKTEGMVTDLYFDFDEESLEFTLNNEKNNKVIGGYSRTCKKLEILPKDKVKGIVRNSYECKECQFRESGCRYFSQFTIQDNLIRIYPQNYLYNSSKEDKNYKPDFVIIDEDPTSHSLVENCYTKDSGIMWKKIIEDESHSITTADYNAEKKRLKVKIDGTRNNLRTRKNDISLLNSYNSLLSQFKVISLLLNGTARISYYDGQVHVYYKRPILKKWLNVPILYLNGTGDEEISDSVFGVDKFDFTEEIRVKYNPNVTVHQLQNQSLSLKQALENKNQVFALMDYFYHYSKTCFVSYQKIISEYLELHPEADPDRFMYFGDTRGKGGFENFSLILVIGRHFLPHQALSAKGSVLLESDYIDECRVRRKRIIEMNDDQYDAEIEVPDFVDPYMQIMSKYYNEGEVLQAISRLRLLHGSEKKTVIYLSNFVIDGLLVDNLLIKEDILLNENRMALVRAVQKEGKIECNKPDGIGKIAGLTAKQVSNLKNTDWFKNNVFFYVDDKTGHLVDRYLH